MAALGGNVDDDDPSAAVADYGVLPKDVLFYHILLRLRLVCRSWRAIISDWIFARAHLSRNLQVVALHDISHQVHVVDLMSGHVLKRVHLVQKSHGLSTAHDVLCVSQGWGQAYVLNIATNTDMADLTEHDDREGRASSTTPTTVVGRVPATGEYKVLRFRTFHWGRASHLCEIVTVRSGNNTDGTSSRRTMPCPPVNVVQKSMALVGGVAYFVVNQGATKADSIALFDLATEEWRSTKLQGPLSRSGFVLLTGVGDCLVFVHCNYGNSSADVWYLVDVDKAIWTKRYPRFYRPLVVLDDGRVAVLVEGARIIRAYDPATDTWTDLVRLKDYCAIIVHHGSFLCASVHDDST